MKDTNERSTGVVVSSSLGLVLFYLNFLLSFLRALPAWDGHHLQRSTNESTVHLFF